jgi:hypothetical protein
MLCLEEAVRFGLIQTSVATHDRRELKRTEKIKAQKSPPDVGSGSAEMSEANSRQ